MEMQQIYTIILGVHTLGYAVTGVLLTFTDIVKMQSWINIDDTMLKNVSLLWILISLGYMITTYGFWTSQSWWRMTAWGSTVIAVFYLVLFWNSFTINIPIQAMIGNVIVVAGLLNILKIV